jgi:alpha-1,2-mannosyltransferase
MYSLALLFSGYTMTNSSWTQAHISSLLYSGRSSYFSMFMAFPEDDDKSIRALATQPPSKQDSDTNHQSAEPAQKRWIGCQVVYPPCDTAQLVQCGKLEKREKIIVSLSQFRWEAQSTVSAGPRVDVQCIDRKRSTLLNFELFICSSRTTQSTEA